MPAISITQLGNGKHLEKIEKAYTGKVNVTVRWVDDSTLLIKHVSPHPDGQKYDSRDFVSNFMRKLKAYNERYVNPQVQARML